MKIKHFRILTEADFFKLISRHFSRTIIDEVIIPGYNTVTSLNEKYILYKLVRNLKPKIILEIGTYTGYTTLGLLRNSSKSSIYTIDICKEMKIDTPRRQKPVVLLKKDVGKAFRGKRGRVYQIFGDSRDISTYSLFEGKNIDISFIDGNHSFEGVIKDTQNVIKFMKPGSIICWHDFKKEGYTEVIQALGYLSEKEKLKIIQIRGTSLAFALL